VASKVISDHQINEVVNTNKVEKINGRILLSFIHIIKEDTKEKMAKEVINGRKEGATKWKGWLLFRFLEKNFGFIIIHFISLWRFFKELVETQERA